MTLEISKYEKIFSSGSFLSLLNFTTQQPPTGASDCQEAAPGLVKFRHLRKRHPHPPTSRPSQPTPAHSAPIRRSCAGGCAAVSSSQTCFHTAVPRTELLCVRGAHSMTVTSSAAVTSPSMWAPLKSPVNNTSCNNKQFTGL